MKSIFGFITLMLWVYGIVVVKGFWMTVLAIFPLAGVYFAVEHIVALNGWI